MTWYVGTFVAILIFYMLFGSWLGRYAKSLGDYYVAGRKMPALVIAGTFMASWTSAAGLVGVAGCAWNWGLSGALWFYGSYFGVAIILIFIAMPMRRGMFMTVTDFFSERFASKRVRAIAITTIVCAMAGYFVGDIVALGRMLEVILNVPFQYTVWGFVIVLAIYLSFSGMVGVAITDVVMFATLLMVCLAFPIMLQKYGGFQTLFHTIPQIKPGIWLVSGTKGALGPDLHYWIGAAIGYLALTSTSPHLLSRAFLAKNEKSLIHGISWGFTALAIALPLYWCAVIFVNMEVSKIGPMIPNVDNSVAYMLTHMLPVWMGCIIIAGITSAGLSSTSVLISVVAQSIVRDFWQKMWKSRKGEEVSDAKVLLYTRIGILILGLLLGFISSVIQIRAAFIIAWSAAAFAMTFLPTILLGLYWNKITEKAVFWGMLTSLVLYLGLSIGSIDKAFAKAIYLSPTIWSTIYSFVFIVTVSLLTQKSSEEVESWSKLKIRMFPKEKVYGNAKDYLSLGLALLVFTSFLAWFIFKMVTS